MKSSDATRTGVTRSALGTDEGGPQVTPEVILAEIAENAKKGGKA